MRRCWGVEAIESLNEAAAADPAMEGERYLMWIVRRLVFCAGEPNVVERSLCRRLGAEEGREACLALRLTLYSICMFGRRRLRLGPPGAGETTRDEALILQLVSAAQHEVDDLLQSSLLWILEAGSPLDPERPIRHLARLLLRAGVVLPAPGSGHVPAAGLPHQ